MRVRPPIRIVSGGWGGGGGRCARLDPMYYIFILGGPLDTPEPQALACFACSQAAPLSLSVFVVPEHQTFCSTLWSFFAESFFRAWPLNRSSRTASIRKDLFYPVCCSLYCKKSIFNNKYRVCIKIGCCADIGGEKQSFNVLLT